MARNYRDLRIWSESHELALELDRLVNSFPDKEKYRLCDQIRRASASIPTNIVEGCGQNSTAAARKYLFYSYNSIKELDYHILLAHDLGYIEKEKYRELREKVDTLGKMTFGFIKKMPNRKHYVS